MFKNTTADTRLTYDPAVCDGLATARVSPPLDCAWPIVVSIGEETKQWQQQALTEIAF
jgi:hypothetical protein